MDEHSREITFDGCFNFRDLGGYPTASGRRVRWRRLFRSDHSAALSEGDCERMTGELGLCTVLDLRAPAWQQESPSKLGVRCVSLPLYSDEAEAGMKSRIDVSARTWMRMNRDDAEGAVIAKVFALLADETSYPLVFHCIMGKDRTALIAALVLGVLGVADEDIVRDYAMSGPNMRRWVERLRDRGRLPADGSFTKELPRSFFVTPPSAMRSLLDEVRYTHGSVRGYLNSCGVAAAMVAGLERALLM